MLFIGLGGMALTLGWVFGWVFPRTTVMLCFLVPPFYIHKDPSIHPPFQVHITWDLVLVLAGVCVLWDIYGKMRAVQKLKQQKLKEAQDTWEIEVEKIAQGVARAAGYVRSGEIPSVHHNVEIKW